MFRIGNRKFSSIRRCSSNLHYCSSFFSTETKRLEDKVALITGAATGIGKATAKEFINHGAKVVIADIQKQLGQEAATELGERATFVFCDVAQESDVSAAVDFAVSKYGRLDIMFNNAGVSGQLSPSITDLNLAEFDRVMNINVRGVIAGIKHAARVMIPRRTGIVKSVAAELCKYGIRVNCISPFAIPTPFAMNDMVNIYPGVDADRLVKVIHDAGELEGVNCEAADIAKAALYLASEDAKYVSGHNLVVDGGFTSFKSLMFPSPDQVSE
ncbi:hypothetical protein MKW94_011719 [Papaver nudicaule]|uniref:Secoisolariciresinol dehydrogenase n=1 Tax=Papaver nudicaule TaxID=74823 RepID=A0AA41VRT0_PAPNU|nr:hypothetical protein [Papaver nudicaule]